MVIFSLRRGIDILKRILRYLVWNPLFLVELSTRYAISKYLVKWKQ